MTMHHALLNRCRSALSARIYFAGEGPKVALDRDDLHELVHYVAEAEDRKRQTFDRFHVAQADRDPLGCVAGAQWPCTCDACVDRRRAELHAVDAIAYRPTRAPDEPFVSALCSCGGPL